MPRHQPIRAQPGDSWNQECPDRDRADCRQRAPRIRGKAAAPEADHARVPEPRTPPTVSEPSMTHQAEMTPDQECTRCRTGIMTLRPTWADMARREIAEAFRGAAERAAW